MSGLSADQARLRPHLRKTQPVRHLPEVDGGDENGSSGHGWKVPVGDDLDRLRGLPAIGRGVTGAIPGTNPARALLAKESRR